MSHTPKKENTVLKENEYSPVILRQTPGASQKNLTGPPRVARDIVADLYNNIQHWNDSHIKGAQIVKQIAILKSEDHRNYSPQLEEYTNDLFSVVLSLDIYRKHFEHYNTQIKAVSKLEKNSEPIFISLNATALANAVIDIANAYIAEFKLKKLVLENIAHSKNKHEAMFYAACWAHQTRITSSINVTLEALLVETGFRPIN
ncbi:cyclin-dependent kinase 2-interacting protein-like [Anoplophora glabripennis]|uniref:cyclin-dependent kinase 2-interacting protein-like n=1 Tax=Anoplophora glabripennis TaxID=217634 RepID=UPI0008735739|nr:cyclin-dependent kinase 2-interacting protein-like [Anoplophora glabripennis]XP_023309842.1 cyclin-dependent kinase 2-interacting protein-like [Anoplophora glabripennis]